MSFKKSIIPSYFRPRESELKLHNMFVSGWIMKIEWIALIIITNLNFGNLNFVTLLHVKVIHGLRIKMLVLTQNAADFCKRKSAWWADIAKESQPGELTLQKVAKKVAKTLQILVSLTPLGPESLQKKGCKKRLQKRCKFWRARLHWAQNHCKNSLCFVQTKKVAQILNLNNVKARWGNAKLSI